MNFASFDDALRAAGVRPDMVAADVAAGLDRDGYAILRGVIPSGWLAPLRDRFEAGHVPGKDWRFPRAPDARHADLDADRTARGVALLPALLAAVHRAFGERFFLADVQGRDPTGNGGNQALHRDWDGPHDETGMVAALAFLDDFSAANGATRLIAGTHREPGGMNDYAGSGESDPRLIAAEGSAGDILVFCGRTVHAGSCNRTGAPRRNLQICYQAQTTRAARPEVRDLAALSPLERYLCGWDA